jgi:hypothetical protein
MKAIAPPGPLDAAKGAIAAGHGDGEWVDGDTQQAGIPAAGVTGGRDQQAAGTAAGVEQQLAWGGKQPASPSSNSSSTLASRLTPCSAAARAARRTAA